MCLSPMPWMLCSPKPFSSIVGHSSASTATVIEPYSSLSRSPAAIVPADPVALTNAASRAPGAARRLEHVVQRPAGDLEVAEVVAELAELVEHEVRRVLGERVARVVDLLDVALRADRADDVLGRVLAPPVEPVEALLAHALGEDRDAAAGHEPADGDAAAGVVAGARPDRPVAGGVELAGDDTRREAGVGGEHLVGGDHREAVAEDDDDRAVDAGQLLGQHDVVGHVDAAAGEVVVPVHAPQVAGVAAVAVGVADELRVELAHGSASSANVGRTMPCSRNRSTLLASAASSTTRSARPNWSSRAAAMSGGRHGGPFCQLPAVIPQGCACGIGTLAGDGRADRRQAAHHRAAQAGRVDHRQRAGRRVRAHRHGDPPAPRGARGGRPRRPHARSGDRPRSPTGALAGHPDGRRAVPRSSRRPDRRADPVDPPVTRRGRARRGHPHPPGAPARRVSRADRPGLRRRRQGPPAGRHPHRRGLRRRGHGRRRHAGAHRAPLPDPRRGRRVPRPVHRRAGAVPRRRSATA